MNWLFNALQTYSWIFGAMVGLAVSIILILILHFTVFRYSSAKWIYIIIVLLCTICGGVIQWVYFRHFEDSNVPNPKDQINNVVDTVGDNWKNTNGGFTFEKIQKVQEDDEAPTAEDQIIDLTCYDFGTYIVFSYYDGTEYQNALFCKADNGLVLDGMINTFGLYELKGYFNRPWWQWLVGPMVQEYDLDSFEWLYDSNFEPTYAQYDLLGNKYDNLVSLSRQSADFVENINVTYWMNNRGQAKTRALEEAAILTGINATDNFINFGDVELIGTANTGYTKINSFYNYLYEQIKNSEYDTSKVIDATSSLCLPIEEGLQKNYPIPASKKSEYGDAEYYGVYNCDIAVNLTFKNGDKSFTYSTKNKDYFETISNDEETKDKLTVEPVTQKYSYTKVTLNFNNTSSSDLSNLDISKNPVTVTFKSTALDIEKTVKIDSVNKLNNGVDILLSQSDWTYQIDSTDLVFNDFKGSFTLGSDNSTLTFDYYFMDNYVVASVGLNPVRTIDTAKLDLATNPVKIILSNDDHTYQFVFDSNAKLDSRESMVVELGTYSYNILSDQLVFASVTGSVTITTTDRVMLFNYGGLKEDEALSFDITVGSYSTVGKLSLYSSSTNVTKIRDFLKTSTGGTTYNVVYMVYDQDGKLMKTGTHTHASTGTCGDTWDISSLTVGQTYTLQLRFTSASDTTVTYLSSTTDFVYSTTNGFQVTYTATVNS